MCSKIKSKLISESIFVGKIRVNGVTVTVMVTACYGGSPLRRFMVRVGGQVYNGRLLWSNYYNICVCLLQLKSVRSRGYSRQPATRRFGTISPKRRERTLRCGESSLWYVHTFSSKLSSFLLSLFFFFSSYSKLFEQFSSDFEHPYPMI